MGIGDMPSLEGEIEAGPAGTAGTTLISTLATMLKKNKWATMFGCGPAFLSGALFVLLVEALIIMFVVLRSMEKRHKRVATPHTSSVSVETPENSMLLTLQGGVWVADLPAGDVKKMYTRREKALKERNGKEPKTDQENGPSKDKSKKDILKDFVHVAPVWRYARLQGRILHLSCQGVKESILLEGCEITAVSGSAQAHRKWTKKYPLKLRNPNRHVYGLSHECLLYLETGWEKEAWCNVLRASAGWDNNADGWYFKLKKEYQEYSDRVDTQFPFLNRANASNMPRTAEEKSKAPKTESAVNTKKRLLWKKFTRKSMKINRDNKSVEREEARRPLGDVSDDGSSKGAGSVALDSAMTRNGSREDLTSRDLLAMEESHKGARLTSTKSGIEVPSAAPEKDTVDVQADVNMERSLLCANRLFARLFFDLYHSKTVTTRLLNLLQRQLAKVPTPSYISKISCTHFDLGNSPPLAHNIRLLPIEADVAWGLEADLEYFGGAIFTIETRIDVRDSSAREKVETLAGAATPDLMHEKLENIKTDFHRAEDEAGKATEQRGASSASTSGKPPGSASSASTGGKAPGGVSSASTSGKPPAAASSASTSGKPPAAASSASTSGKAGGASSASTSSKPEGASSASTSGKPGGASSASTSKPGGASSASISGKPGGASSGSTSGKPGGASNASTGGKPADVRVSEEGSRKGWMQSSITNVKAMMSQVAERVSQVPLSLTIRVTQIKGTLRVRIKPPPSDRVWFSFTEMPSLELSPEPCIGDHKINNGPLGSLIVNQLKILLRDSMVSPQGEDLQYSWMISEAGNWIARDVVPLAFVADQVQSDQSNNKERRETQLRRENSVDSIRIDASGVGPSNSLPGIPLQSDLEDLGFTPVSPSKVSLESVALPVTGDPLGDLKVPMLEGRGVEVEGLEESNRESDSILVNFGQPPSRLLSAETQTGSSSDSDSGQRNPEELVLLEGQLPSAQAGKRAKVFTFGRKMGTKLDERRRRVLEKMRDRSQQNVDRPNV